MPGEAGASGGSGPPPDYPVACRSGKQEGSQLGSAAMTVG
jgi:hypothetical protein